MTSLKQSNEFLSQRLGFSTWFRISSSGQLGITVLGRNFPADLTLKEVPKAGAPPRPAPQQDKASNRGTAAWMRVQVGPGSLCSVPALFLQRPLLWAWLCCDPEARSGMRVRASAALLADPHAPRPCFLLGNPSCHVLPAQLSRFCSGAHLRLAGGLRGSHSALKLESSNPGSCRSAGPTPFLREACGRVGRAPRTHSCEASESTDPPH